ncbi:MAG: dienelactone hydrolase family protein [Steroidobacteraceae bacterium]
MQAKQVDYYQGGRRFVGYLAWDERRENRRPGVVVFPEAFGLNEHAKLVAQRLATMGYVALAADPHGEGVIYDDFSELMGVIGSYQSDRSGWRGRANAALAALTAQPNVDRNNVVAIGYCFGGTTCFELARCGAQLRAVATFHAGLNAPLPEDAGRLRTKVLICHGADDPVVSQDAVSDIMTELRAAKVDWQLVQYGGAVHSFSNPEADKRGITGIAYNAQAHERSWVALTQLLDEVF